MCFRGGGKGGRGGGGGGALPINLSPSLSLAFFPAPSKRRRFCPEGLWQHASAVYAAVCAPLWPCTQHAHCPAWATAPRLYLCRSCLIRTPGTSTPWARASSPRHGPAPRPPPCDLACKPQWRRRRGHLTQPVAPPCALCVPRPPGSCSHQPCMALSACRRRHTHRATRRAADARERPPPCRMRRPPGTQASTEVRRAAEVQPPGCCVSFTRQHAAAQPSRLCPRRRRRLSAWRRLVQALATAGAAPRRACAVCCVRGTACVGGTRTRQRLRCLSPPRKRPRCCNTLRTLLRLAGA